MRRISRSLIASTMMARASLENDEATVVEATATTTPPVETQTTPETVVTTSTATVPAAGVAEATATAPAVVEPATEGVLGALGGAALTGLPLLGNIVGGVMGHKLEESGKKIAKLESELKQAQNEAQRLLQESIAEAKANKRVSKEDGETEVPATDAVPEATATEPMAEPVVEPTTTTEPAAPAADVAAQAAADALAAVGVPADTQVVVTVVEPVITEQEQNELADAGEEVEGEMEEATRVAAEAEEVAEEVNTLLDTTEEVGRYAEIAQDASENGGLSDDAAKIMTVAVESAYARVGLAGCSGIPSMESFQGKHSRVGATTISVEDMGEKVKAFIAGAKEGIKKFIEFVVNFFKSVFTAIGRMESRAKKIKEAASNFKGNSGSSLESPSLFAKLVVGSSIPSNLASSLGSINEFTKETTAGLTGPKLQAIVDYATKAVSNSAAVEEIAGYFDDIFGLVKEITGTNVLSESNTGKLIGDEFGVGEAPEGTKLVASPVFPGNNVIWAYIPESGAGVINLNFGIATSSKKPDGKSLPNLSGSEISKIADAALAFVNMKKEYDLVLKNVETQIGKLDKVLFETQTTIVIASASDLFKFVKMVYRTSTKLASGSHHKAMVLAMKTHNAALDYAQLALASGNKSDKAPEQLTA